MNPPPGSGAELALLLHLLEAAKRSKETLITALTAQSIAFLRSDNDTKRTHMHGLPTMYVRP